MANVIVADVMCGGGKTSAAIEYINSSPADSRFVFVTPYLPECDRLISSCPSKEMIQPLDPRTHNSKSRGETKLSDMWQLLAQQKNIASTHALFPRYTDEMIQLIKDGHYTLIIDESYEMTQVLSTEDKILFQDELNKGSIEVDEHGKSTWVAKVPDKQSSLYRLYLQMQNGAVYKYGQSILVWLFPRSILDAFERVIVLTYMFETQTFRYYLDLLEIPYQYIGTKKVDGGYQFCDMDDPDRLMQSQLLRGKIHILDNKKLNSIGLQSNSLSSTWFQTDLDKNEAAKIHLLARNIRNVQKNVFKCSNKDFIWTVYNDYEKEVADKNIRKKFVVWNKRATNEYRDCHYLAYGINVFAHPDAYRYFHHFGIHMDVDRWALSIMIQWIWRSAIRNGEDIWIYIPSRRMRELLADWINEVSNEGVVA